MMKTSSFVEQDSDRTLAELVDQSGSLHQRVASPFPALHWRLALGSTTREQSASVAASLHARGYRAVTSRQIGDELFLLFARCQNGQLQSIAVPVPFTREADSLLLAPRSLFLAIWGPDGVGKSSVLSATIAALSPLFEQQRTACWRPQLLRSRVPKQPHQFKLPHEISVHRPWISMMKLTATFLDFSLDRATLTRNLLQGSAFIAWDRYFPDLSVDAKRYRYNGPDWYSKFLLKALRLPESFLGIVLEADEEVILQRKQELPREELRRQLAAYRQLTVDLPHTYCVGNNGDLTACLEQVLARAIKRMADSVEPVAASLLRCPELSRERCTVTKWR